VHHCREADVILPAAHERPEFDRPISIEGAELQESVMAAELPSECSLSIIRAFRLVLAWHQGREVVDHLPDARGVTAWEQDALGRLDADMGVWASIAVIAGELQDTDAADAERLAHACLVLSEWAFTMGAGASGLLLVETAALASPSNARRAYLAGRILRERGRMREAERWLRRSMRLAAATGDEEAQALAMATLRGIPGILDNR
jgi:hypothetical protein